MKVEDCQDICLIGSMQIKTVWVTRYKKPPKMDMDEQKVALSKPGLSTREHFQFAYIFMKGFFDFLNKIYCWLK